MNMSTIRLQLTHNAKIIFLTLLLSGCTSWLPQPHRIDIQQGNIIRQESRDQLKPGMSKADVRAILGDAILQDPFHPDRWDYIYSLKSDTKEQTSSRLTLFFKDDLLTKIDGSHFVPAENDSNIPADKDLDPIPAVDNSISLD